MKKRQREGPGNGRFQSFKDLSTRKSWKVYKIFIPLKLSRLSQATELWPILRDLLARGYFCGLGCPGMVLAHFEHSKGSENAGMSEATGMSETVTSLLYFGGLNSIQTLLSFKASPCWTLST